MDFCEHSPTVIASRIHNQRSTLTYQQQLARNQTNVETQTLWSSDSVIMSNVFYPPTPPHTHTHTIIGNPGTTCTETDLWPSCS